MPPATRRRPFIVPSGRNKAFVGREDVLQELLAKIAPDTDGFRQRIAVKGLGGMGKTQIALEVAFRVRDAHPQCSVFWVPAISAATFENAYLEIAEQLNIDGISSSNADVKSLVKAALRKADAGSWLLVVDNADDTQLMCGDHGLSNYLLTGSTGSILFTTRNHQAAVRLKVPNSDIIAVDQMREGDAATMLRAHPKESQLQDDAATRALLSLLCYLPLAIKQAVSFMSLTGITTARYLQHCQSNTNTLMNNLLSKGFGDRSCYAGMDGDNEKAVATTWLISFEHISRDHSLAAKFLVSMGFLAEKDIPLELLLQADPISTDVAIGALKAYAFISEREGQASFDMHRLVQLAIRVWARIAAT